MIRQRNGARNGEKQRRVAGRLGVRRKETGREGDTEMERDMARQAEERKIKTQARHRIEQEGGEWRETTNPLEMPPN